MGILCFSVGIYLDSLKIAGSCLDLHRDRYESDCKCKIYREPLPCVISLLRQSVSFLG